METYHDSKRSDQDSLSSAIVLSRRGGKESSGHRCDNAAVVIFRKRGRGGRIQQKKKGRPGFQLSAAFIGGIFVDAKLSPGGADPKDHFQKAVKRLIFLGLRIDIVRADSAYMTHECLFFLSELSPGYAIGAPATFNAV